MEPDLDLVTFQFVIFSSPETVDGQLFQLVNNGDGTSLLKPPAG